MVRTPQPSPWAPPPPPPGHAPWGPPPPPPPPGWPPMASLLEPADEVRFTDVLGQEDGRTIFRTFCAGPPEIQAVGFLLAAVLARLCPPEAHAVTAQEDAR